MAEKLRTRFKELYTDAQRWRAVWVDIQKYLNPDSGMFLQTLDTEIYVPDRSSILNNVAGQALGVLMSGLHGGLTSPSRPWFRLTLPNEDLLEDMAVQKWLSDVRDILLRIFAKSNFYTSIHMSYGELGGYGTACTFIDEDFDTVIRCRPLTAGEYYLDSDDRQIIDTVYRVSLMTARQMARAFGEDKISQRVKSVLERKPSTRFLVLHVIRPIDAKASGRGEAALRNGFTYESLYLERDSVETENAILRHRFYRTRPFIAPRWLTFGNHVYGTSPGFIALSDIKMLQRMEKDKLKGLAKTIDPPMKAGPNLKPAGGNIIPGGVTYVTDGNMDSYQPSYQVNLNLAPITAELQQVETRIRSVFFNDLFISILQEQKTMTAREVVERHDEKLLLLGPTLERLQGEMLDTAINRVFDIAWNMGLLPPPPDALQGYDLSVEYVSLLAQAQKLVGLSAVEQLVGFSANLSAISPEAFDKLDVDEIIEEYAQILGVKPSLLRKEAVVEEIRKQRAQALAAQQAAERGALAAKGAKELSQTQMGGDSALDRLMPGIGG